MSTLISTRTASVIICAYTEKRWDELLDAVRSIDGQTMRPIQLIVVIDHNDALYEKSQQTLQQAIVIKNSQKQGLSGARNSGIDIATGDIVAFMDEDATAESDWLETLCAHYDDPTVNGVGGQIVPHWLAKRPLWFPDEFDWVVGCTYRGMPEAAAPVRNLIGCNMSFRRQIFEQIGGFREEMGRIGTVPVGCEETELCIRSQQKWPQHHLIYEPKSKVLHRVPAERGSWHYFRSRCYAEGISKAMVTAHVGAEDGLSNERNYVLKTLPMGVITGGIRQAAAIILGLGFTTWGYVIGKVEKTNGRHLPSHSLQSSTNKNQIAIPIK